MAWTTPSTAVAGSTALTAAFWNEQVRDNLTELAPFFGAWTSYTPTLVNITIGTGGTPTNSGRYLKIGRMVWLNVKVKLGTSGFSVGTSPTISLPVNAAGTTRGASFNLFVFDANAVTIRPSAAQLAAVDKVTLLSIAADSTFVYQANVQSNQPITFAANDEFELSGFYEAAS